MGRDASMLFERRDPPNGGVRNEAPVIADLRRRARTILKLRRSRERLLDARLFGEPSWDILLELFVAYCDGKPVTVSAIAQASAAPTTTGLRYITLLAEAGLVERSKAGHDRRTVVVTLTDQGLAAMETLLADYPG